MALEFAGRWVLPAELWQETGRWDCIVDEFAHETLNSAAQPRQAPEREPRGAAQVTGFTHPGAPLTASDLATLKSYIDQGRQPWKSAYDQLANDGKAKLTPAQAQQIALARLVE